MQSECWGPSAWLYLHSLTFNFPIEPSQKDKELIKLYFNLTSQMLPCSYCRNSFVYFLTKLPIDDYLHSRYALVYWLYVIHNMVNLKHKKPMFKFKDCLLKYEKIRANTKAINILEIEKINKETHDKYNLITSTKIKPILKDILSLKH